MNYNYVYQIYFQVDIRLKKFQFNKLILRTKINIQKLITYKIYLYLFKNSSQILKKKVRENIFDSKNFFKTKFNYLIDKTKKATDQNILNDKILKQILYKNFYLDNK